MTLREDELSDRDKLGEEKNNELGDGDKLNDGGSDFDLSLEVD